MTDTTTAAVRELAEKAKSLVHEAIIEAAEDGAMNGGALSESALRYHARFFVFVDQLAALALPGAQGQEALTDHEIQARWVRYAQSAGLLDAYGNSYGINNEWSARIARDAFIAGLRESHGIVSSPKEGGNG